MNGPRIRGPGLAIRLAIAFAAVAIATAAAVAIAAPPIVGRGFAMMQAGDGGAAGMGPGRGMGAGPGAGTYIAQAQQEATVTIVVVAVVAAAIASLVGIVLARRIARPLEDLEAAAAAISAGDLSARSGLSERDDEVGSLGRSFDAMAADLERSEASRQRFFQDVVHELKTPLAVIDATAAAVMDGVYAHDDRHLTTIREQAGLLGRIVDDLRTISLAEAGALPLEPSDVHPAEVAAAAATAFSAGAIERDVTLELDLDRGAALVIVADRGRLSQVVNAYLDNAIRHAPSGSKVTVRVEPAPDDPTSARITVADEGPGIAAEDLPHVFDRFYQADRARDRGSGTSGLGLAIARALAAAMRGTVGAEDRVTGGAAFWVDLPLALDGPRH